MKLNYRFSNLLGCAYRKGNLIFSSDGEKIFSPVGNRVTIHDLKNFRSNTLQAESKLNITTMALSPNGLLLIAINEEGFAMLINVSNGAILYQYDFHGPVECIKFSPNGRKFALTKSNSVLVYNTPGDTAELNPFIVDKRFLGMHDSTTSIDWTSDSRVIVVGSKDMNAYVIAVQRFENLLYKPIGGHKDAVMAAFFQRDSLDLCTISEFGELCVWESDTELDKLVPEGAVVEETSDESSDEEEEKPKRPKIERGLFDKKQRKKDYTDYVQFRRLKKVALKGDGKGRVTAADFNKLTSMLVIGFETGVFYIYELPDVVAIKPLKISDHSITAITMSPSGDLIGIGSATLGELVVVDWTSSEPSMVLKQQSHFNRMRCLAYSPDGRFIATGGDDCKVKLWDVTNGHCIATFTEHSAAVTGVVFSNKSKAVISSSLDGTVQACDAANRYRKFRTFTAPAERATQFSCVAAHPSGDMVAAGGYDKYDIYLWNMKTGQLIDIFEHEAPVSDLSFTEFHNIMASASLDHTVRLWNISSGSAKSREVIQLTSDALAVAYRPDGKELAVATLDGQITFWDVQNATLNHTIEGRHDLGYTRREKDKITAKKASAQKAFLTLCYTADGSCILAGGQSKYVCIYSIANCILLKKFEITCNFSLDGISEFLDRKKMSEWGNLALIEEGQVEPEQKISLPGVRKVDFSSRSFRPEVRVSCVRFSPTGMSWAATTTEGLLVYSIASTNVVFDPFDFAADITPASIRETLAEGNYRDALLKAFRLNETPIIVEVMEQIPTSDIDFICNNLPNAYIEKILKFVSLQIERSTHLQFYVLWAKKMLEVHTMNLKSQTSAIPVINALQKSLIGMEPITQIYDYVTGMIDFMNAVPKPAMLSEPNEEQEDEAIEEQEEMEFEFSATHK